MDKKKIKFSQIKISKPTMLVIKLVTAVLLLAFPLYVQNSYYQHVAVMCGIYIVLTLSLNLVSGFAGQLSMGHAAFYGIGAYVTGLMMTKEGMNFWLTLLFSMLITGVFGLLLGLPTSRLKGDYFTIVTLGAGEIVRMFLVNQDTITNGAMGVSGIGAPMLFGIELYSDTAFYYMILALVVIVLIFLSRLIRSGFGLAMMTIREDEIAAQAIGIRPMKYKLLAFVISAMIAGLAGSFYASYVTYISPNTFVFNDSATMLAMMVLGGIGSIPGSVIGAVLLTILPEVLRSLSDYRMIIYGLAMVIMMNVRPTGFYGAEKRIRNSYQLLTGGKRK